jgi:hypothetical protein
MQHQAEKKIDQKEQQQKKDDSTPERRATPMRQLGNSLFGLDSVDHGQFSLALTMMAQTVDSRC